MYFFFLKKVIPLNLLVYRSSDLAFILLFFFLFSMVNMAVYQINFIWQSISLGGKFGRVSRLFWQSTQRMSKSVRQGAAAS